MRRLSLIVFILLLAIIPSCKFFRSKGLFGRNDKSLAALQAQQDSIRVADSIKNIQDQLLVLENAHLDSARMAEESRISMESMDRYNIIIGSFITPEYAKAFAEEFRQRGYESKIIKKEGSRFELVAAESHEDFSKAFARLKKFQDTVEMDAWIYIIKR